jgi:cytochrome c peroxidase
MAGNLATLQNVIGHKGALIERLEILTLDPRLTPNGFGQKLNSISG